MDGRRLEVAPNPPHVMSSTLAPDTASTIDCLSTWLAGLPIGQHLGFRLWDGTLWPDFQRRDVTLVLKHPGALQELVSTGTAKGMAEAYLRDDIDVEGDMEVAVDLAIALQDQPHGWRTPLIALNRFRHLPEVLANGKIHRIFSGDGKRHSLARDRQVVSFHYDVSNDFYRLWLDEQMVYSCGYFTAPDQPLGKAQTAKLDYLCRKLRLHPGQRLLDIGCGWGGLAMFAAKFYGVQVTGVTLSAAQAELARARVREAGLERDVAIELQDYRQVDRPAGFDAVVSVGMAEHVGRENLPGYFKTVWNLLRPGGVFLNHAIGEGRRADRFRGPSFVDAYVFPDSDIPPLPVTVTAAAEAGFEIRDVENLREHYTLTLRHWVRRLEEAHERALEFVDEATYRIWRVYLAGSAHGFDHGDLAIYQTLLAKPTDSGRLHLPLTRKDWYQ